MPRPPADPTRLVPTSAVLQRLHDEVPANHFTLGWLMHSLRKRSFGIIMLLLALVAIAPGLSIIAGLLLMIPAFQMIAGNPLRSFPRRIATRSLPTRHLAAVVQRSLPVLRYLEKVVHPRWHTPLEATKRPGRHHRRGTERHPGIHSNTLEQRRPRLGDCLDLPCLSRGGWGPALDRLAGRRHCFGGRGGGSLADGRRRKMDHRSLVATCLW